MEPVNPYESPQIGQLVDARRPSAIPETLADMVRLGTSLYIANFLPIAGIMLAFSVPMALTQAYADYFAFDPEDPGKSLRLTLLFQNVIGLIPQAGVMAIGAAALKGQQPTFLRGLVEGFAAWPRMFVTRLIVTISILLALVLFVIPGIYVGVRTAYSEPAALIEHRGGMSAPGRSFELTKGRFWQTFCLLCIVYGVVLCVGFSSEIPRMFFDHWLLSAASSVVIDLLSAWAMLVLVTAYHARAHRLKFGDSTGSASTKPEDAVN